VFASSKNTATSKNQDYAQIYLCVNLTTNPSPYIHHNSSFHTIIWT